MKLSLLLLVAMLSANAAARRSEFEMGRADYAGGEYRTAATHFETALKNAPADPALHYWTGKSYQVLADISFPLDHKYKSRARLHLTRAVELAPSEPEYRRELFLFLLHSGGVRQAAALLTTVSESDPDYGWLHWELDAERSANASPEARLGRLFLAGPRAAYAILAAPSW